ncbi:hypothetical protein HHI36_023212 [Cryptolaemus montrouzieri]|uniref:Uncharacterized protein n=1 Tax=Cryptolaemus montrouzieri TaxID=559131 RepID=A0ABD2PGM4_9CUCU
MEIILASLNRSNPHKVCTCYKMIFFVIHTATMFLLVISARCISIEEPGTHLRLLKVLFVCRQSSAYSNSQSNNAANYMVLGEPNLQQTSGYHQAASQMPKYPPPLVDVRHMNGGMTSRDMQNSYAVTSSQNQLINQPTTRSQTANEERNNVSNGRMNLNNCNRKLPSETLSVTAHVPYQMQKAVVENKMLPCINFKPYDYTDLLVTLPDLCSNFFNNVRVQSCQQVLQVLGVELYKPNNSQVQVLRETANNQNHSDQVTLVQVRSVIDFMPQLKYMLGGVVQSDMGSKRARNS